METPSLHLAVIRGKEWTHLAVILGLLPAGALPGELMLHRSDHGHGLAHA